MQILQVPPAVVWPVRHQVMYPELDFENIKLESDNKALHLALLKDQKVTSVVSLFIHEKSLQFRKFATLQEHQGKGYGSLLLQYIIDFARAEGFKLLWCNARTSATSFYKRFGFKETETTFSKDGHHFVVMELSLDCES